MAAVTGGDVLKLLQHVLCRLTDSLPGLPQSEHGGVGEGSADLRHPHHHYHHGHHHHDLHHPVVVVKAPADVRHRCPLLYSLYPGLDAEVI